MSTDTDPPGRDRWARLRFAIVGPLLAAPPPEGQLKAALDALAVKGWRHPITGFEVAFGVSTLERWYYAAQTRTANALSPSISSTKAFATSERAYGSRRLHKVLLEGGMLLVDIASGAL